MGYFFSKKTNQLRYGSKRFAAYSRVFYDGLHMFNFVKFLKSHGYMTLNVNMSVAAVMIETRLKYWAPGWYVKPKGHCVITEARRGLIRGGIARRALKNMLHVGAIPGLKKI